jgi:hypothetical protein
MGRLGCVVGSFALAPVVPLRVNPIAGGGRSDVSLPLNFAGQRAKTDPINVLQLAFKNQAQVFYGQTTVPLEPLMGEDGRLEPAAYMQFWQEVCTHREREREAHTMRTQHSR